MIFRSKYARALCLAMFALAAVASSAAAASKTQNVNLQFQAVAGSQKVSCGTAIKGLGTTSQTARLQDLRLYVTGVELLGRNGRTAAVKLKGNKPYQLTKKGDSVSLIDLENGSGACSSGTRGTNSAIRGTVAKGDYTGVRFSVGVPYALNHTDVVSAPAPLNSAAMAWNWQFGRKFAKIEFADPGGATGSWPSHTFLVHLGSNGCTGDPATGKSAKCSALNIPQVKLAKFNPRSQSIGIDLKALLAGSDIAPASSMGAMTAMDMVMDPGCMSEQTLPTCGPIFKAFGLNWKADGSGTGKPSGKQSVFRAVSR